LTTDFFSDLLSFWQELASEVQQDQPHLLVNLNIPFYLSNAAWLNHQNSFDDSLISSCYQTRALPVAVLQKEDSLVLPEAYKLEHRFVLRKAKASTVELKEITEQVSWSQLRFVAQLLATNYEQPDLVHELSKCLSKAMQSKHQIIAYLGYAETATSALIAYETNTHLIAMLAKDESKALEHRLYSDAQQQNKTALILEIQEQQSSENAELILERWVKV